MSLPVLLKPQADVHSLCGPPGLIGSQLLLGSEEEGSKSECEHGLAIAPLGRKHSGHGVHN